MARKGLNANEVLENINKCIAELDAVQGKSNVVSYTDKGIRIDHYGEWWRHKYCFRMRAVCNELSIFDWWNEMLTTSRLKQMASFCKTAIKLGYTGYVCFKVGEKDCSHGMWAYKNESEDGFSPDGDFLYHSFTPGENYYNLCIDDIIINKDLTLAEVKEYLKEKSEVA